MKRIITLLSLLLVLMMAICLSACQLTPPAGGGDGGGDTNPPDGEGDTNPPDGGGDTNPPDGEGSNTTYTVTFMSDGVAVFPAVSVNENDKIPEPEALEKYGYEFLGWYVDGEPWSFSFGLVTGDITLTAKWQAAVSNVFLLGNGAELMYDKFTLSFGSYYSLETPARDGFTFLGWFDMDGNPVDSIGFWTYTDDVVLQASWQSESSGGNTDNSEGVYWRETELIFEMNKHSQSDELSSEVDRYYAGEASEGELVDDYVAERNKAAAKEANVRIQYSYLPDRVSEYSWGQNVNRIYNETAIYGPGSVDMYCNFAYDMTCASIKGCFANLRSTSYGRGNNFFRFNDADYSPVGESYFDSNAGEGYFYDYMKSLSLSDDKLYCLGSNYCTDLVRAFLVIPVNINLMNRIERGSLPTPEYYDDITGAMVGPITIGEDQTNIQHFYDIVWNNAWTYDVLAKYSQAVYIDKNVNNPTSGNSNLGDRLGFALGGQSQIGAIGMLYSTSVSILDKTPVDGQPGEYTIGYGQTNPKLCEFSLALSNLMIENADNGITVVTAENATEYGSKNDLLAIRNEFVNDNILFGGIVTLGSLEDKNSYQTMRAVGKSGFGIVPVPLYRTRSAEVKDEYNTLVHNLARIVAIAAQTDKFEMCSAFLDYQSRNSSEVLNTYYTQNLAASVLGETTEDNVNMLTYIRNHVGDCFDMTYDNIMGNSDIDEAASNRRWHEVIRLYGFNVTGTELLYDRLYLSKIYDIEEVLAQWNALP